MPVFYNISPYPQVLDPYKLAVFPGDAVDVPDDKAPGLSPTVWSAAPPVPVMVEEPAPTTRPKRDPVPVEIKNDTPAAETPAPEEDTN